jgi:hypothetical protein
MEKSQPVDFKLFVSGGQPPFEWMLTSGTLPPGLTLKNGQLTGTPTETGVFPVTIRIDSGDQTLERDFTLIVRDRNRASDAEAVLANVRKTDTAARDSMWLSVHHTLYADDVAVLTDGVRYGDGSTFYSIDGTHAPKTDFYGYEWKEEQNIGMIGLCTGAVEENGGWFTSLNVQYKDEQGGWKTVEELKIVPELLRGDKPFNKAHFIEYLMVFKPVETKAVRIIGEAGNAPHWLSKTSYFTSVAEITVHAGLPGYEGL